MKFWFTRREIVVQFLRKNRTVDNSLTVFCEDAAELIKKQNAALTWLVASTPKSSKPPLNLNKIQWKNSNTK